MRRGFYLIPFMVSCVSALTLNPSDTEKISDRIWMNEGKNRDEWLLYWSAHEPFPSLGIGHFIWYKEGQKEIFQETFPELIQFLVKEGVQVPSWLLEARGCPWETKEAFYEAKETQKMESLKTLLLETRGKQVLFMTLRLERVLDEITAQAPQESSAKLKALIGSLMKEAQGVYALTDYLNFKGSGLAESERYAGYGWGLKQVFEKMQDKTNLEAFVDAAKQVLLERVKNAPKEKGEERWIKGWNARLETYLHPL